MSSGIFTRKAGELIFHDKIQQSSISQDSASVRGAIRVLRKSLLLVLVKSHNLVVSWAIATNKQSNTRANKRQAKKGKRKRRRGRRNRGRIRRQGWSGGKENERQMATNVMREIGIVMGTWYVDFLHRFPSNGARNSSCYLLSLRWFSPKRKGWCSRVA